VAYSQSGQSPKIQIYGMMVYSNEQEFYADVEKPMDLNFESLCSMGSMAMIRPQSQNTSMSRWYSFDQKFDTE
jgi:hypothetical protein